MDLLETAAADKPDERNSPRAALFIGAWIDDADLSPAQFRVLCRIARRGDCTESVPNIATGCHLHPDTVESALRLLLARGFITKEARPGRTSILRVVLNPPPGGQPTRKECPPETEGHVFKPGDTHAKRMPNHPPETEGDKGSPCEGDARSSARW